MRKLTTFPAVLILFLLEPASITWAQTITSQKGLTTAVFALNNGNIKLYLPEDIRHGDIISATLLEEPFGSNVNQINKNLVELKKCSVTINGEKFAVGEANKKIRFKPEEKGGKDFGVFGIEFMCTNPSGKNAGKLTINPKPGPVSSSCIIPTHALTAAPLRITGPFDGNASNTNCMLNDKPVEILAESPRQCFVMYPAETRGIQTLTMQENKQPACSKPVSAVNMNVSSDKLNLLKGEKTFIDISITGLQDLPGSATLTLSNTTISTVALQPSNKIVIVLTPDSVVAGNFHRQFNVQSIRSGSFSVNVNLDLPDNGPVVFADVHIQEVKGLKSGMSDAFEKVVIDATGTQASKHPELDGCGSCLSCIQARLNEDKVALVGWLGETLIMHFAGLGLDALGGLAKWIKDRYEDVKSAGDAAAAINKAINDKEIQVVEIPEKQCEKNGACLVTGIAFYDTKTSCIDVFLKCIASKACCPHAVTTFHIKYCVGEKGFILPKQSPNWEVVVE
jgi:hypothetical protein